MRSHRVTKMVRRYWDYFAQTGGQTTTDNASRAARVAANGGTMTGVRFA